MKIIVYAICAVSFSLKLSAQQIEFKLNLRSGYGYANTFNHRYFGSLHEDYKLENTRFYHAQKVKSITVYQVNNKIYRYWEFDTSGTIVLTGVQNYYYTEYSSKQTGPSEMVDVTSYYLSKGGPLVRRNTVYRKYTSYTFADTVVGWTSYKIIEHKSGALINEQNNYYNTHFYNKKVVVNESNPNWFFVDEKGAMVNPDPRGYVYLEKMLKTNYKPDRLYKCSVIKTDQGFFASCNQGHNDLSQLELLNHPVAKKYNRNSKRTYLIDGEWFEEPVVDRVEPMYCNASNEYRNDPWLSYSVNSRGLYDTCYIMQLVLDTRPEAIKEFEKQKQENIKNGMWGYEGPYQEKPHKQMLYYFRYEYY